MQNNLDDFTQSMPIKPHEHLIIMGGGLAGLSLAIELRQKHPTLMITVIERQVHPVTASTHKVGESTVEIGAHYFATVLGLKPHLMSAQLKKFGFRFFFSDRRMDLDAVTELGASQSMPTGSFQLDRGIFENYLAQHAINLGVTLLDGTTIRQFTLADVSQPNSLHQVTIDIKGETKVMQARWLIDASGRSGLIKRKLNLAQDNAHKANAVWFRMSKKIDVNQWSSNEAWLDRCTPRNRWLSTNHLVGNGYWVWLIPLASGSHSVGIVCDAHTHPIESMNTFDKAMLWLNTHQPRLHQDLLAQESVPQDFAFFKHFSYGCKQVFSGNGRWAITGEAGVFLDPFYSPGSDFIGMGNGFITELVSLDLAGKRVSAHAEIFQKIYLQFYENMLPIYTGQYKLFADPQILPIKLLWDYTFYWGVMCQLFCQNRLTDLSCISRLTPMLDRAGTINRLMQTMFNQWGDLNTIKNPAHMLDQYKLDWLLELNRGLTDELSNEAFFSRMTQTFDTLDILAGQTAQLAQSQCPSLDISNLVTALASSDVAPLDSKHKRLIFPQFLSI
jgi:2-polyprenyl-6-methoxyphenol hydroxylase-like FAD-dependent oxidoreductase